MIKIKQTTEENLRDVQRLWADGDVMRFVGFPDGLHRTEEDMQRWYRWIVSERPGTDHFSVYEDGVYCGETFYAIDKEHGGSAAMDIKLFRFARDRGIASAALSFAIDKAFENGAERVWVDPNPENAKALALYNRLGFVQKDMPAWLLEDEDPGSVYMEIDKAHRLKTVFESENIRFVEVSETLIPDYLVMVNDHERVNRFIGSGKKDYTEEQERAWVRKRREEKAFVLSMIEKKSGRFIGNIELMENSEFSRELGIAITAEMQDKGFGTEAIKAFIPYGMERLGLQRIRLRARPFNARAIHVYEKCGFTEYDRSEEHIFMEILR